MFLRTFAVLILLAGASACDRGPAITGRTAELVVVVKEPSGNDTLTRDARIAVSSAPMGETSTGTFLVRNIGDGPLTLTKATLELGSTAFALELPAVTTLRATEEVEFTVTFSPEQASDATLRVVPHEATFKLDSEGGREGERSALIELFADAEARDCYVPAVLDFGDSPIGQAVVMPIDLSNATTAEAQATLSAVAGPNPAFFTLEPAASEVVVPASTRSETMVRFAPATEAEVSAELVVRRRASCPAATVRLVGRGSTQSLSWLPMQLDFGRVPLAETATRGVTFSNRSGATLPLTLSVEGDGFVLPMAAQSLPARGTLVVAAQCRPNRLGALTGTLRVDVGTSPILPVRVPLRCAGGGPRLRVSPAQLSFGNVPVLMDATNKPLMPSLQPSVTRRLRVENVGTPPADASDTTYNLVLGRDGMPPLMSLTPLGNTLQGEFSVSIVRYPTTGVPALAGKNFVDVEVRLQPAGVGVRDAALTVYSNDAVQATQTVRITATGTQAEACSVFAVPTAVSFGDVPPDSTESATLTLMNTGSKACLVAGLELAPGSNPGYSLSTTAPSLNIGPGGSFSLQVRFDSKGQSAGTVANGFVRFTTADKLTRSIPVMARIARCLVALPEELDFGNIKLGCGSAPRPVQIFNSCGTAVRVTNISAAGTGFGIAAQPMIPQGGLLLSPNAASTTVSVAFRPGSIGTHLGTLTLLSMEGQDSRALDFPLRGVGDSTGITVETYTQPTQPQADILFTIDDSCSMADEQAALASNFSSFISYATTANVDYRIAVTTTDDDRRQGAFVTANNVTFVERTTPNAATAFRDLVNVGIFGSGFERPIATSLKALTAPLIGSTNAGFLRDDANLAIIMITDAPDQSPQPISYYQTRLPLVKGARRVHQVTVSAIGPFSPASGTCSVEGVDMSRYDALIRQTGGVKADICTSMWAMELQRLGNSALGPRNTFFVRNPPDTMQPIDVMVNGVPISNAWSHDTATNAIVFAQGQAPGAGTTLSVTYHSVCLP